VGPVDGDTADEWASVVLRGFGMPEEGLATMMAASVENPHFRPYAVWDGNDIVGGASLFIYHEVGALNAASTLPSHRNRGAQSALIAIRAREAGAAGCRWLTAETGKPTEDSPNPSLNNLVRAGFQPLYHRRNWNWEPSGESVPPSRR
jgi:hypothetical protein